MECGSFHRFFHRFFPCFSLNPLKYPLSGDDITGETKNPQKVKTCIVKDDNRYGQQNRTGKEETMSVNGVTSTQAAAAYSYNSTSAAKEKTSAEEAKTTTTAEDTGVIYEHSTAAKTSSTKKTYTPDTNLVNRLKADAENRASQLRSLVEQMMGKQANTYGNANDIWSFLRSGNFTVDPATKAQAQADIAEDGYWGVNQTSDRIIQFANALTGGDPDKIESMREAFKKGYAQAEKTWGGSLPEISQKTYDAVMEKFDKLAADAGLTTEE
jgi:hypothetical protein